MAIASLSPVELDRMRRAGRAAHTGHRIREGMAFTVEPMVNAGSAEIRADDHGVLELRRQRAVGGAHGPAVGVGPRGPEITTVLD